MEALYYFEKRINKKYITRLISDTYYIIHRNAQEAKILRENKIYNSEGDAIINIELKEVGSEYIRIWQEPVDKSFKDVNGSYAELKSWNVLAGANSIIQKNDILVINNKRFKVESINKYTFENHVYKHNLKIEEIV